MRIKKRTKSSRSHGKGMGTSGWGARKKHKKTGHRGGKGFSGSGKRADHKKTLVIKKYGAKYFGKQGITSKKTQRDTRKRINLRTIELNLEIYISKGLAKKTEKGFELDLSKYKILGSGELKSKLIIKAKEASKSAVKKIKKTGGEIILKKVDKPKKPVKDNKG